MVGAGYLEMLCTHFLHAILTESHGSLFISSADLTGYRWIFRLILLHLTNSCHFYFTQGLKASYFLCFTKISINVITLSYISYNMFKDEFAYTFKLRLLYLPTHSTVNSPQLLIVSL